MPLVPSFGVFDLWNVRSSPRVDGHTLPTRPIYAALGQKALAAAAWLFEKIMGAASPGSPWIVGGHDHGPRGGWPIPRGAAYSADAGNGYIWSRTIATAATWEWSDQGDGSERENDTIRAYASPGIDTSRHSVHWEAYVGYVATGLGAGELRLYNHTDSSASSALALTFDSSFHWLHFTDVPVRGGDAGHVNALGIQMRSNTIGDSIDVLACLIAETVANSQPAAPGGSIVAWDTSGRPI